ncbi:hypothetical protein CK203_106727 [Vitis vinifera]|uniref:RNase H type-1 domain-containing protein n=1 Tax=Vitis vinifera TaxID=29760 RepID=A0A438FGI2_VITVI|nr:hypothetical protein CK203_106727 [Vitis vinifera]
MGRSLTGLENPGRILSGFNGASTTSLGDIVLPGAKYSSITLNVQFSVVQDLSPFNVILGRTWLYYMKAIPLRIIKWEFMPPSPLIGSTSCQQQDPSDRGVRRFHPDRQKIIRDEIDKLLEAGFIREVEYPGLAGKCSGGIDQIVDSTTGQGMLSFLDAFSEYHQIPMSPADEEKIAFITPQTVFIVTKSCYLDSKHWRHLSETDEEDLQTSSWPHSRGKLVALGCFIARFTDELRPFFLMIRKAGASGWTDNLLFYSVTPSPKEQKPVYYVSRALADVETRLSSTNNQVKKNGGLCGLMEPPGHQYPGVGLLLQSLTGEHLEQAIRLGFLASNNEAEYEAILSGLDLALALSVSRLRIYSDSHSYELKMDVPMPGRHSCFPPHQEVILLPIHVQATLSSRKPPLAIPLRQAKQTTKSRRKTL